MCWNDICPEEGVAIQTYEDAGESETNLGSSVASLALSTPMTAVSAISGCVRSTLSSSAGGTESKSNQFEK